MLAGIVDRAFITFLRLVESEGMVIFSCGVSRYFRLSDLVLSKNVSKAAKSSASRMRKW